MSNAVPMDTATRQIQWGVWRQLPVGAGLKLTTGCPTHGSHDLAVDAVGQLLELLRPRPARDGGDLGGCVLASEVDSTALGDDEEPD